MTTKYTPGEWSSGCTQHGAIHIYDEHGSQIAFVVGRRVKKPTPA